MRDGGLQEDPPPPRGARTGTPLAVARRPLAALLLGIATTAAALCAARALAGAGLAAEARAPVVAAAGPTETPARSGPTVAVGGSGRAATDPRGFLPGKGEIPGWEPSEEPRIFNGKDLFTHIDGGAEEFLAQGFRALGVGAYRADSLEIVAEIYNLGSPKGAKAILDARGGAEGDSNTGAPAGARNGKGSNRDSSDTSPPESVGATPAAHRATATLVGDARVLDPVQVLFRRGRFYVAVTGFESRPEVAAGLRRLADSIDVRIRAAIRPRAVR